MGRWMERLKEKIDRMEHDETEGVRPVFSYHRFFQGYSERKVPRRNGKGYRVERVYTADYIRYAETDLMWRACKLYYLALLLGALLALLFGGTLPSGLNAVRHIGIAQVLGTIPVVYLCYTMLYQIPARRLMTLGDFETGGRHMRKAALFSGIYLMIVFFVMAAETFRAGLRLESRDLQAMAGQFIGAFLILMIYLIERGRTTERVKNNSASSRDANQIW